MWSVLSREEKNSKTISAKIREHTQIGNPTTRAPAALATTAKVTKAREERASAMIPKANAPTAAAPPSIVTVTRI